MGVVHEAHILTMQYLEALGQSLSGSKKFAGEVVADLDASSEAFDQTAVVNSPFPWLIFLYCSTVMFALCWCYRIFIVIPVARKLLKFVAVRPDAVNDTKVEKFAQAHLEMVMYTLFTVLGSILVFKQNWLFYFEGKHFFSLYWWTEQRNNQILGDDLVFFYVLYAARYFQQFITVFFEKKRKDFWEMQIHHFSTLILVILSYSSGQVKIGLLIMVLMDYADPLLHFAKQVVYFRGVAKPSSSFFSFATAADVCFAGFALIFTVSRMICYPFVVYRAMQDNVNLRSKEYENVFTPRGVVAFYEVTNMQEKILLGLLVVLLFLQVFWYVLLLKIIVKVVSGAEVDDNRSDSESDSEEHKKTK